MNSLINEAESLLLHTYNRYPIVFDHGDGVRLYDLNGKEYLDFVAGISVFALGYNNKEFNDALKAQIDKIIHTSNYYYNEPAIKAAKRLLKASQMDRVFFCNSGAEAVEGAIKTVLKHAFLKDGTTDHEIIAMEHSFHGRTLGALSVTGNPKYREAFEPGLARVKYAKMNDLESVKALVNDKTCAIIFETVQGEGGIYPATEEFIKGVRKLCDEKEILLVLDEIQCGMGRTGYMFAWQKYGVKPDVMTVAKALGCGVPIGAFLMTQEIADSSLVAGDHGSTYGGNPFVCAAADKVLELFEQNNIIDNVKNVGDYLYERLESVARDHSHIVAHRGVGLIQGLEFDGPVSPIINAALEHGLVLINAGSNIIRFVPPLVISKQDVDEMINILLECLD
ncbi:MAG: aspartate aminotransferase family protein [Lachnospiraceae bacterium]|nr:aspartate aminotransferase family protein [Lachnospiraceae bacterium]